MLWLSYNTIFFTVFLISSKKKVVRILYFTKFVLKFYVYSLLFIYCKVYDIDIFASNEYFHNISNSPYFDIF